MVSGGRKAALLLTCMTILGNPEWVYSAHPGTYLVMLPKTLRPSTPRENLPPMERGIALQGSPAPFRIPTTNPKFVLSVFPPNDLKNQLHQNGNPDARVRFHIRSSPVILDPSELSMTTTNSPLISQIIASRLIDCLRVRCSIAFDQKSSPCKKLNNAISSIAR
ncbi:hypothetical protein RvY_07054 [Ramazzottius varieornatus]|uniref:Uncharacterized protein n=1 Tax=Ramazzottius varieornatus TaxID=947166 RepID=A0A1D1V0P4_RAMVA|nr:hypothetical protein RvY_07054 [Ramazzottius varieornatus]